MKRIHNERTPTPFGMAYCMRRAVGGDVVCIVQIVPGAELEHDRHAAALRVLAARRKLRQAVAHRALSTSNRPAGAP